MGSIRHFKEKPDYISYINKTFILETAESTVYFQ